MTANVSWRELYQAALVEVQPGELQGRIDAAAEAICRRNEEIKQAGSQSSAEQQAIADALRTLRVLARTECPSHLPLETDVPESDVAS
jgi:hypothetical protein